RNINPLQPLLAGIVRIPERRVALDPEDLQELFFDPTEGAIPRPPRGQKTYYSGQKKRHTVKHQVVVTRRRKKPGPGTQPRRARERRGGGCGSRPWPGRSRARHLTRRCTTGPGWCARRGSRGPGTRRTWGPR